MESATFSRAGCQSEDPTAKAAPLT
jgi:hypothetical protein